MHGKMALLIFRLGLGSSRVQGPDGLGLLGRYGRLATPAYRSDLNTFFRKAFLSQIPANIFCSYYMMKTPRELRILVVRPHCVFNRDVELFGFRAQTEGDGIIKLQEVGTGICAVGDVFDKWNLMM